MQSNQNVPALIVAATGFILAGIGITIQWLSGISNAKFPVGVPILIAIAIVSLLRVWRWTPLLGVVFCTFILVTAFVLGGPFERLTHLVPFGPFIGTVLQMLGLVSGITAGITAVTHDK